MYVPARCASLELSSSGKEELNGVYLPIEQPPLPDGFFFFRSAVRVTGKHFSFLDLHCMFVFIVVIIIIIIIGISIIKSLGHFQIRCGNINY